MATTQPKFSLYWLAATGLAFWFLVIHTPPVLIERDAFHDPLFLFHLVGVYTVYLACIHNSLFTPTVWDGISKPFHVWVGRIGLLLGVPGFLSGFYLTWSRFAMDDPAFSIGISIGGMIQMWSEWRGWQAIHKYKRLKSLLEACESTSSYLSVDTINIEEVRRERDEALKQHIIHMLVLFVMACGIPAAIRIVDGFDSPWPMIAVFGFMNLLVSLYIKSTIRRAFPPSLNLKLQEKQEDNDKNSLSLSEKAPLAAKK